MLEVESTMSVLEIFIKEESIPDIIWSLYEYYIKSWKNLNWLKYIYR